MVGPVLLDVTRIIAPMHLMVPFASVVSQAGRAAIASSSLPSLRALLARLDASEPDAGDEWSLGTPHERALARELGLVGDDGALPWAARLAAGDGIETGELAWGLLSPTHWHVGTDLVSLADPDALALDADASRALLAAVAPLFEADGFVLRWGAPTRWYAAHASLAGLRTASLDRVIGRNVDRWLPSGAASRTLRRLQSEVQMLLYTHPLNAEREARGLLPVNSFWASGCGVRQPAREAQSLLMLDALRGPALAEDWAAWHHAWQALDAGPLAEALAARGPFTLTLAGERSAQRFEMRDAAWWSRIARRWRGADVVRTLESL